MQKRYSNRHFLHPMKITIFLLLIFKNTTTVIDVYEHKKYISFPAPSRVISSWDTSGKVLLFRIALLLNQSGENAPKESRFRKINIGHSKSLKFIK